MVDVPKFAENLRGNVGGSATDGVEQTVDLSGQAKVTQLQGLRSVRHLLNLSQGKLR